MYDIIGDIHGFADTLEALLDIMGYRPKDGVRQHPVRKAIFTGDFIDRGPQVRRTLEIVEPMVRNGFALSVAGNHEANALAYMTADEKGHFFRPHTPKNRKQAQHTLSDFSDRPEAWNYYLKWFQSLPLYLDLPELRVIHACWEPAYIAYLKTHKINNFSEKYFLKQAYTKGTEEFALVETLLKGRELELPDGYFFYDKDKTERRSIRIRWWENLKNSTYADAVVNSAGEIPDLKLPSECGSRNPAYPADEKPVFFGHYWLRGKPRIQKHNVCCLDYSVGKCAKLVAYRFDGEQHLDNSKFVFVECLDKLSE